MNEISKYISDSERARTIKAIVDQERIVGQTWSALKSSKERVKILQEILDESLDFETKVEEEITHTVRLGLPCVIGSIKFVTEKGEDFIYSYAMYLDSKKKN
jgi:hypothetical protein